MTHGIDTDFLVAVEILEHPHHAPAEALMHRLLAAGDDFALVPQVLGEFIHIVSDSRRMPRPLTMSEALTRAEDWWNAAEVVRVFPSSTGMADFFQWMRQYQLGRKRILDTMLAAALRHAGIKKLITNNRADFAVFDAFEIVGFK
jgi:predicted nucleic acid-binding protein